MKTKLEQYLNMQGYNRTNITELLNSSPPTTRLLMQDPTQLKVSQVCYIAEDTMMTFQEIAGLIFDTHYFVSKGDEIIIRKNETEVANNH